MAESKVSHHLEAVCLTQIDVDESYLGTAFCDRCRESAGARVFPDHGPGAHLQHVSGSCAKPSVIVDDKQAHLLMVTAALLERIRVGTQ